MSILAFGLNHKSAPISLREKVIFQTDKLSLYLNDLLTQEDISEAVILSTCNRSEIYCNTKRLPTLMDWFCRQHQLPLSQVKPHTYYYEDKDAVEHMMQVACGLDSMVLGESQILSQMKQAYSESCAAGLVGPLFNRLFQEIFAVSKDIRKATAIGACPVSVSSAAVKFLLTKIKKPLAQQNLLLIGAGVTIELVLRHLRGNRPQTLWIANRNIQNAATLAKKYEGIAIHLDYLPKKIPAADIIISATGGSLPIITPNMIPIQREKELYIIDLAVPRDVSPDVMARGGVHLYSIDDLKSIIESNLISRQHAAEKAREVIKQKSETFITWLQSVDLVATTIKTYRKQIENLCHAELTKSMTQLNRGEDPALVLVRFAHSLTNKLLHTSSVQLRQAGYEGRLEFLQLVQQFFAV